MAKREPERRRRAALAGGLAAAMLAAASPAALAQDCAGGPDLSRPDELATAKVSAARAHFYRGGPGCPAFRKTCRETAYVVAGDRVIVSGSAGDFVCAHYVASRRRAGVTLPEIVRSGWLSAAELTPEPAAVPAGPDAWTGTWRRVEAQIRIAPGRDPGTLAVAGEATFGGLDPARVKRGAVNTGEFSGEARPQGGGLSFAVTADGFAPAERGDESSCKVWLRRVGPWLLAEDNGLCGGANVSFRGLYSRAN
ncbi:hypothetical protein ACFFJB_08300 [Camelimonas abortus]|uniref:Secreted protein n=1 Tax=Camelimonas abortus TaxID=1017184 RepID=A0ABV7LEX4_9HYPH